MDLIDEKIMNVASVYPIRIGRFINKVSINGKVVPS
jgi:hypothetical protein